MSAPEKAVDKLFHEVFDCGYGDHLRPGSPAGLDDLPEPALNGRKSFDILNFLYGIQAILDELIRIEHGVLF